MKLLLRTSKPENWDADWFLLTITPEHVQKIRQERTKCLEFLKPYQPGIAAVELGYKFDCFDAGDISYDDATCAMLESGKDWLAVPDDFVITQEFAQRIECRTILYSDTSIWLSALDKYSSDVAEAELTDELLDMVAASRKDRV